MAEENLGQTAKRGPSEADRLIQFLKEETPFLCGAATFAAFEFGADALLNDLGNVLLAAGLFVLLFAVVLWASFGVARHADALAEKLGEPLGTLILTLSVTAIEVSLIASNMLIGQNEPTIARDSMFAVLMIVLNGLVGIALLVGGHLHKEQSYNLQGARSFLAVLVPLSVFALILPDFTISTRGPTFEPSQAGFLAVITVLLYGVFLLIQTTRHRAFFVQPFSDREDTYHEVSLRFAEHRRGPIHSLGYHAALLIMTFLPIALLSKRIALVVDFGIHDVGAPVALGGVFIAALVLAPESMAALKAAAANKLQRAVNLLLGSALATIGLTLPAALTISLVSGRSLTLGLSPTSVTLLMLTLFISWMTFSGGRTNILLGAVHLVLFLAYLMLIFHP